MKKLLFTSTLVVLLAAGCSTSQTSKTTPKSNIPNQTAQSQVPTPSPTTEANPDEVPCGSNDSVYTNGKYNFTFQCLAGLKVRFYQKTDTTGILTVVGDKNTSITLTVNGPPVPLDAMQEISSDQSVTTNSIVMRKRLITDPVIGNPPYQNQEVIYDYSHSNNTFMWWAIFKKDDTVNQNRMNQIIGSFKFTN